MRPLTENLGKVEIQQVWRQVGDDDRSPYKKIT